MTGIEMTNQSNATFHKMYKPSKAGKEGNTGSTGRYKQQGNGKAWTRHSKASKSF